jgi:fibronectin type 3 domain-containing protein
MNRYLINFIIVLFSAIGSSMAQENYNIAFSGPRGIYVFAGNKMVSNQHPDDGVTAYQVEKRRSTAIGWTEVGILKAPANLQEMEKRMKKAVSDFPKGTFNDIVDMNEVWQKMSVTRNIDSLYMLSGIVPLQVALGTMIYDRDVKQGVQYQYRVLAQKNNNWTEIMTSGFITFEPPKADLSFYIKEKEELGQSLRLKFAIYPRNDVSFIFAERRSNFSGPFEKAKVDIGYIPAYDSLIIRMEDTLVEPNTAYEYIFSAYDLFGNRFALSDTLFLKTFSKFTVNTPYGLKVYNRPNLEGNVVSWKLDVPGRIANIAIYRSKTMDGKFEKIGDASAADTMFLDQTAIAMEKYWYYLEMQDITGGTTFKSAKIFAMYKSSLLPEPPGNPVATPIDGGVGLKWRKGEPGTHGYYVYRSTAEGNFDLISNLIADTVYIDKSAALRGDQGYWYAIQAENTSYLKSKFSTPVYAIPSIKTVPLSPTGLTLVPEARYILVKWDPVSSNDPTFAGYFLLRREAGASEWNGLNKIPLAANYFRDSTAQTGKIYEYAVQSANNQGLKSAIDYTEKTGLPYKGNKFGPPTDIKVTNDEQEILVTWAACERTMVSGYRIYRKEPDGEFVLMQKINNVNTHSFSDRKIQKGKLYLYQLSAVDKNGHESTKSKPVAIWF